MYKTKVLGFISLILLIIGASIIIYTYLTHKSAEEDMQALLYQSEGGQSLDSELPVGSITGDMQVKEIKTLKDCIVIKSCNIKAPLVEGTMSDDLRQGVGHFTGTASIGQEGNCCYAGHYSTIYNCVFNGIENLNLWSEIDMYDSKGAHYIYFVTDKYITESTDLSVLQKVKGEKRLTLVTCAENGTRRLIIEAVLMTREEKDAKQREQRADNLNNFRELIEDKGVITVSRYLKNKKGRNL